MARRFFRYRLRAAISTSIIENRLLTQGRILVVDDEKDICYMLKLGLSRAGFDVTTETDPIAAFEKFKPGVYDLVILDEVMPDVSGLEFYQKMLDLEPKIKVCFFSAVDATLRMQFAEQYPDWQDKVCFVEKPVPMTTLVEIVRSQIMSAR